MNVKDINNVFLNPEFVVKLIDLLREFNLVDDISVRNSIIRKEWYEAKNNCEPNKDFVARMAAKYFLSEKSIESILYQTVHFKKKTLNQGSEEDGSKN